MLLVPPAHRRAPLGLRYALLRLTPAQRGWTSVSVIPDNFLTASALAKNLRPALDQLHAALHRYLGEAVPAELTAPLALDDATRAQLATDRPVVDWLAAQNLEQLSAAELAQYLRANTTNILARSLTDLDDATWHPDLDRSAPRWTLPNGHAAPSVLDAVSRLLYLRALDALGDHLPYLFNALEHHWAAATRVVHDAIAAGITRTTTSNDVVLRMNDTAISAWRALNSGPDAVRNVEHLWQLRTALIYAAGCYINDQDLFDSEDKHTHPGSDLPAHRTRWLSRLANGHIPLAPAELVPAFHRSGPGPRGSTNPAQPAAYYIEPDELAAALDAARRSYPDTTPVGPGGVSAGHSYPQLTAPEDSP